MKRILFGVSVIVSTASAVSDRWCPHEGIESAPLLAAPSSWFDEILAASKEQKNIVPVLVIGSGPAGMAAAFAAAQAKLHTVMIAGSELGGQLADAKLVDNIQTIAPTAGATIMDQQLERATQAGVTCLSDDEVTRIERAEVGNYFIVHTAQNRVIHALTLIAATGAGLKRLGVPGEAQYMNKGIFSCAACDGREARNKRVMVIARGPALQELLYHLMPLAQHIIVVALPGDKEFVLPHREPLMRAASVETLNGVTVSGIIGDGANVQAVRVVHTATGEKELLPVSCLFVSLGREPNSRLFAPLAQCTPQGFLELVSRSQTTSCSATSCPGMFAAGNVTDSVYKRAPTAMGDGVKAACDALLYLRKHGFNQDIAKMLEPYYL
jgi:thioredoxin reductase (NADPH)